MLDFLQIEERTVSRGTIEIRPKFRTDRYGDLMIKGGDFDAFWNEETGMWSTDERALISIVDDALNSYLKEHYDNYPVPVKVCWMWDADSGAIDRWHKYCQKQMRDNYHTLDQKVAFLNTEVKKTDYVSHRLPYVLEEGDISAYETCMNTWYDPSEREKLEWIIGAIIFGDIDKIEKFIVLYGPPKSGKSSFLKHILMPIFDGYWAPFDSSRMAKGNFWGESFKDAPLVSIQTDGKLSRIDDNSIINAVVSHETVEMNLKNKSTFPQKMRSILFLGTNEPVKISDAKSGIIRRLLDVNPSGRTLPENEYYELIDRLKFEYGAIAQHCLSVYSRLGPYYYNDYISTEMLAETNDFYNFIEQNYEDLKEKNYITGTEAWRRWQEYKTFADIDYKLSYKRFCAELKNYFKEFKQDYHDENGKHIRNVYFGFMFEKFKSKVRLEKFVENASNRWIILREQHSLLDDILRDCPAQYIREDGKTAMTGWERCKTKLCDIDTSRLHYVRVPLNHIVIDIDLCDEEGRKDKSKCLEEANKWPKTYVEVSKGGGIHLHYIYKGDPLALATHMPENEHIEIKVYSGLQALRRKVTECNNILVAPISCLPLKEDGGQKKKVVDFELYENEKALRSVIEGHIKNWVGGLRHTIVTINLIADTINEAYNKGFHYDISDMYKTLIDIAKASTNNADPCQKTVNSLHLKSKDIDTMKYVATAKDGRRVFFDIECFQNLFVICWKYEFSKTCQSMVNPSPEEVMEFIENFTFIGFNNRKYDNHVMWERALGKDLYSVWEFSKRIISNDPTANHAMAWDISYTDIYDFASAGNKMSLKKYEILLGRLERRAKKLFAEGADIDMVAKELKISETLAKVWYERRDASPISHLELGLDWNEPVPEELWDQVVEYCKNDVYATEDVFHYLEGDFKARLMLSALSGLSPNATTNQHTMQIMFGNDRNPQSQFIYTNLAEKFPGYVFENGKSMYRGEDPSEGGYVKALLGMWLNVATLDIGSMHPTTVDILQLFGPYYTKRFASLKAARIHIKHKEFDEAAKMLDGKLAPYLDDPDNAKALADALKTAINSVYGLTSASFPNRCKDPRNVDNIVAKHGALFMINLYHAVEDEGYTVAHIKTDSIKVPNADTYIINFISEYGKKYGYTFEHESTYDRMCLVNDAVFVAKYADAEWCKAKYGYIPEKNEKSSNQWTATGTQFQVPYVFKKLFSKEDILFEDLCEIKSVSTALYLDMNEGYADVSQWEKLKALRARQNSPLVDIRNKFSKKERELLDSNIQVSDEELEQLISVGHDYKFVGRVGEFCPIKPGHGGGLLVRKDDNGYSSANGAKGYRWLESETVLTLGLEDSIDMSYHEGLCKKAVETISKYTDFDNFVNGDNLVPIDMNVPEDEVELPFD